MTKITIALLCLIAVLFVAAPANAQTVTTSTTLAAAMTRGDQTIQLVSSTGVSASSGTNVVTAGYIDKEYFEFVARTDAAGTGNVWTVRRSYNTSGLQTAHASGAKVWISVPATFDHGTSDRAGACTSTSFQYLPIIMVRSGLVETCDLAGKYSPYSLNSFFVPASQCTWSPTTLTQTSTLTFAGASNLPVLKGISNAAAGTMTLNCVINVPSSIQQLHGAIVTDITLYLASSATGSGVVPTSVGTSTLATITMPAAATTETASTVTPVAIGGTVTTTGAGATGFLTAVTTDGAFYTIKHTYATAVDLSTDLRMLVYTMPILQSAAAVSTLFTPGLQVHYSYQAQ